MWQLWFDRRALEVVQAAGRKEGQVAGCGECGMIRRRAVVVLRLLELGEGRR